MQGASERVPLVDGRNLLHILDPGRKVETRVIPVQQRRAAIIIFLACWWLLVMAGGCNLRPPATETEETGARKTVPGADRAVAATAGEQQSLPASPAADYLLASFTTSFDPRASGRVANITRAAEALDGYLISPGEEFSFNRIVGPRTEEAGYVEALVIENQEYVPGVGGGVCQVSSTLYNAALRAGLPIRERHHHSRPVEYVPPGLDATVVYGALDLRFQNDTGGYLKLASRVDGDSITVTIYGEQPPASPIQVQADVQEVLQPPERFHLDPQLPVGKQFLEQEGQPGYRVKVTRARGKEERSLKVEVISRDVYSPVPVIWRLGTGGV